MIRNFPAKPIAQVPAQGCGPAGSKMLCRSQIEKGKEAARMSGERLQLQPNKVPSGMSLRGQGQSQVVAPHLFPSFGPKISEIPSLLDRLQGWWTGGQ